MSMEETDPEILVLCGYKRLKNVLVPEGGVLSLSFVERDHRLTVTSSEKGGSGSALPLSRDVVIWGRPSTILKSYLYKMQVAVSPSDGLQVSITRLEDVGRSASSSSFDYGTLVDLEPPTPMEMLAAAAQVLVA
jgi:hypothetical protein